MKHSKVLVFSIALIGYDQIFRYCIDSHRAYCQQHDYDYVLIDKFPGVPDKEEATWLKIILIIEALKAGYDWVFFIDADCEVRLHTPAIAAIKRSGKSIYLAPGHSGFINAGILITESAPESMNFFKNVLDSAGQDLPELSIPELSTLAWSENPNIVHFAKNNDAVCLLEHRYWNNNTDLDPESYVIHYSSGTFRAFYLEKYASQVAQMQGKVLRKIYTTYLQSFPKRDSLKLRLDKYKSFYASHYPVFQKQASVAGVAPS